MKNDPTNLKPWWGYDLDGTLAEYHGFKGPGEIGKPIPRIVNEVKRHLAKGTRVKIFTARAAKGDNPARKIPHSEVIRKIEQWSIEHIGQDLEITNEKDFACINIIDDRCEQVEINTGRRMVAVKVQEAVRRLKAKGH